MLKPRRLKDLIPGFFWAYDRTHAPLGIVRVIRFEQDRALAIVDYNLAVTHLEHTPFLECTFLGPLEPPAWQAASTT